MRVKMVQARASLLSDKQLAQKLRHRDARADTTGNLPRSLTSHAVCDEEDTKWTIPANIVANIQNRAAKSILILGAEQPNRSGRSTMKLQSWDRGLIRFWQRSAGS